MARKPTDLSNLRLRLPEGLRKRLATEAERNQRSLNSEIVWRLGQSLGAEGLVQQFETEQQRLDRVLKEAVERILAARQQER